MAETSLERGLQPGVRAGAWKATQTREDVDRPRACRTPFLAPGIVRVWPRACPVTELSWGTLAATRFYITCGRFFTRRAEVRGCDRDHKA